MQPLHQRPLPRARHRVGARREQRGLQTARAGVERIVRELRSEAAVQLIGRRAVHACERLAERARYARRHASPQMHDARVAVARGEPFEEGRPGEIRHVVAFESRGAVERRIRWQLPLDCPLSQHRRPHDAVRAPDAAHDPAFDERRVAFRHPARRVQRHGSELHGQEVREPPDGRIARFPREMRDVREFVNRELVAPRSVPQR